MDSPNAERIAKTAVQLENASDRVFDCFTEARWFGPDYGECKLKFIAEIEPCSIIAVVHLEPEGYTAGYTIYYAGNIEPAPSVRVPLYDFDVSKMDLGQVATVVAMIGALDYTTSDPEDSSTAFTAPLLLSMVDNDLFSAEEMPEFKLRTAGFDDSGERCGYTGAISLLFEDFDVIRLTAQVTSEFEVTSTITQVVSLTEDKVYGHDYFELMTQPVVSDEPTVLLRAARELASAAAQWCNFLD